MFNGLRFRLTLIFIGLAIGPLIFVGTIIGQQSFTILKQQSLKLQYEIARRVGCDIEAFIEGRESELVLLDTVHSLGTLEVTAQRALLSKMLYRRHAYQEIALLGEEGKEKMRLSRSKVYLKKDLKSRATNVEFMIPQQIGGTFFGPVRFDETIREPLITISIPLVDKRSGAVISVLVAELSFKPIWSLLADTGLQNEWDVYVLDREKRVVAHRNPAVVLRGTSVDLPANDDRTAGLAGQKVVFSSYSIQLGTQVLRVVAERSLSSALGLATQIVRISIVVTSLALLFAILFTALMTHQVVKPIKLLANSVRLISDGDFSQKVKPPNTRDEIDELARSFNSMALALNKHEKKMQEQQAKLQSTNTELEQRVKQRTAELTAANVQLKEEVTERIRAEESRRKERDKAQTYLDVAGVMILVIDTTGIITLINRKGCEILGYEEKDIIGRDWFEDCLPERYKDSVKTVFLQLLRGKVQATGYYENAIVTRSGEERVIAWHNTVLRDDSDRVIGTLSSGEDVTERKIMEEELIKAQKLESLSVLAGGIAHDYNNILTAILGNISLAKIDINSDDEMFKVLTGAEKAALQLKDLTTQLLTFSKGGSPVKEITSIEEVVRDSTDFALSGSSVRCESVFSPNLWLIELDRGQIRQVINNIMINAKQAMPDGGKIKVFVENQTIPLEEASPLSEGRYVVVTIEDRGIGIPEKYISSIFDPYFTTKGEGSGLGLAVSYSIVKQHGGHISVVSEHGVGTTFSIFLPASKKTFVPKEEKEQFQHQGGRRILLMDDEEVVRDISTKMLKRLGHRVEAVEDGGTAIDIYLRARESGDPFDIVILDLTIPGGMGGKDAIKHLSELDSGVIGIASSGYADDPIMSQFRENGFRGVLAKPYGYEELSRVLASMT